ncbi:Glutamate receptor 2-7 [Nymphaea thermarum]|nr:Glutamate receptor 2-7 [Nymphaea thermarum]
MTFLKHVLNRCSENTAFFLSNSFFVFDSIRGLFIFSAIDLLKNVEAVQAILGPLRSGEADFVANIGEKIHVPVISFTATSPSLSLAKQPYFIRAAQNDVAQIGAIVSIVKLYGWREIVTIYEDNDFGSGMIPFLADALQQIDVKVASRSVLPTDCSNSFIKTELYRLMTMQTRVFVVHVTPSFGRRLFLAVHKLDMMSSDYVWIVTNGVGNLLGSMNSTVISAMQGVLGVRTYVPETAKRAEFVARWSRQFRLDNPDVETTPELDVFGLWSYDTIQALAFAVERTNSRKFKFQRAQLGNSNSTDVESLRISRTGRQLLDEMLRTNEVGMSGEFRFVNGELQSNRFEVVNVIGKGERVVGVWTPQTGLSSQPVEGKPGRANLSTVVWPGDPGAVPKGWVVPTNGNKLRIGVPYKTGFSEFLQVRSDPATNKTTVRGYCIDVFEAVVNVLPYSLSYEFVPFIDEHGKSGGTYNQLVDQVILGKYDAVVGDVTIIANRSNYVDFTLPYTESGVSLLVPMEAEHKKSVFVFSKPLTAELWITSGSFFVFTGLVVWLLEHRINPAFRGTPLEQIGVTFYFAFSTMVFAHKERLQSNLARFVVIVWVFVVLILTSSYTASLTSILTFQQLRPTVTSIQSLVRNGDYIGYLEGSFVPSLLERMNVDKSKLREYSTAEQYKEGLTRGSGGGGVSAIVDEIPYIKLFLAKYCTGFSMVGPTYKTGGFGFVFPKGSPFVADISRAVLNITEGDSMASIQRAWFERSEACADPNQEVNSNSLTFSSFWGLFLITGTASLGAIIVFLLFSFHQWVKGRSTASLSAEPGPPHNSLAIHDQAI